MVRGVGEKFLTQCFGVAMDLGCWNMQGKQDLPSHFQPGFLHRVDQIGHVQRAEGLKQVGIRQSGNHLNAPSVCRVVACG